MRRIVIGLIVPALLVAAGCSFVCPADRQVIRQHRDNAVAIERRVAEADDLPEWVRTWWRHERDTWRAMDDWAHRRRPDPANDAPVPEEMP